MRENVLAESMMTFEQVSRSPPEAIRKIEDGVRRQFEHMEVSGELDWLPA